MVRERPIIFCPEMVQAILVGRKTQTRRVVKPSNSTVLGYTVRAKDSLWKGLVWDKRVWKDGYPPTEQYPFKSEYLHVPFVNPNDPDDDAVYRVRSRYEVGDRLWVREAWNLIETVVSPVPRPERIVYRASPETYKAYPGIAWQPAIFMPRRYSRLTLEVTNVRVQRVQDITEEDAIAEGCQASQMVSTAKYSFALLWNALSKKGARWLDNPWVWVLEFKTADGLPTAGELRGMDPDFTGEKERDQNEG